MPAKDIYHNSVKNALLKDGWVITHDPFFLRVRHKRLAADLGAEQLVSADKGWHKIVVEIKSFTGLSDVKDLEQALGQYVLYSQIMQELEIDRDLYLAVPHRTFKPVFETGLGAILLKNQTIKVIVFNDIEEVITQWIPS